MDYQLRTMTTSINVSRIAYIHYFEFTGLYSSHANSHNFCEMLYVDTGVINVNSENYDGVLVQGQIIIHRPGESHILTVPEESTPNVIIIGFECDNEELEPFSKAPVTISSDRSGMIAKILQEAMNYFEPPYDVPYTKCMRVRENHPFASEQMIKLSLEVFLISLVRDYKGVSSVLTATTPQEKDTVQAIHRYLTENYTSAIYLDKLCFLFKTNKTTLCKQFKAQYGTTILGYVNNMRIKKAKALIRENEKSITEIAEGLGFDSIHYFSRLFKKTTGMTPTEYLKSVKAKLNM